MDIFGSVGIRSDLSLDELAALISDRLCGGIAFGGKDEGYRDEVPAVATVRDFLGLGMKLWGDQGEYCLDVEQWDDDVPTTMEGDLELSAYLFWRLGQIPGIQPFIPVAGDADPDDD
jgi:hypothetical protein